MIKKTGFFLILSSAPVIGRPIDFVKEVRPILKEHCYQCHGPEKQKSGLRLDVKKAAFQGGEYHPPAITPGDTESSNLLRFVRGDDEEMLMPPKGQRLTAAEINTLTEWIEQGAPWPEEADEAKLVDKSDHWSFKSLAKFNPDHGVDFYISQKLAEAGLAMSPEADRHAWLRRVTFDLIGLPPTPEEVEAFLNDESNVAYEKVTDRLLASLRYGERWGQHWLDVVRYADTDGFEVNTPRENAWPYRDYVIAAFNDDTPYNQFIREQLAGDQLGKDAATGFLVTAARLLPGQIGKDPASMRLARQDELGEIVINTSEAFLGLTVGCARCHNHKFDAIPAKDYYTMQAFFAGVYYGDRPIKSPDTEEKTKELAEMEGRVRKLERELIEMIPFVESGERRPAVNPVLNVERFAPVKARKVRFTIQKTNQYEPCLDELEVFDVEGNNIALSTLGTTASASGSNIEANTHELEFINDGNHGNTRSWMCSEKTGWVQLTFPGEKLIDRIVWGRDRKGQYADRLPLEYQIEVADDSGAWQIVASSSDRKEHRKEGGENPDHFGFDLSKNKEAARLVERKKKLDLEVERLRRIPQIFGGIFGKPEPTHLLNRGDAEQPKEEVDPAVLSALGNRSLPRESPDADRRLALANWIASPDNPLTARVAVNRIWQGHFGIGLVETSNDFGRAGAAPSHPQLLDWLAAEFIRSGWSRKHLHRLIVLSKTYRQSSRVHSVGQERDADVRLLWRFPSRRLEAEGIRDSMLAVSGRLNLKTGGPGFDLFKSRGGLSGFPPVEVFEGEALRRMIYAHKIRMEPGAVFGAFDCPDAGQSVSRRRQSTSPIQALNLFNSRFVIDQSASLAARLQREAGSDPDAQIRHAYQLAYSRQPDREEIADAAKVVNDFGLPTFCRALFNSNEFLFIP